MRTFMLSLALTASIVASTPAQGPGQSPRYYDQVYVLCIGVENYKLMGIAPAKYSVNDAKALGARFKEVYGYNVELLINEQATGEVIRSSLKKLCDKATAKDAVIVFFAGHGMVFDANEERNGFFLPYDAAVNLADPKRTPLERWKASCLPMQEVVDQVVNCKARHGVVIADACFSGFMSQQTKGRGTLEQNIELRMYLEEPGRTTLAASTEKQGARWDEKTKHGVFTNNLLMSLKYYEKEAACINDVFDRALKTVPRVTEAGQLPQIRRLRGNGELVLLPVRSISVQEMKIIEQELAGERVRSDRTRGMAERFLERKNGRTTLSELYQTVRTYLAPYEFSSDSAKARRVWEKRVQRFKENAALDDPLAMAALHYCFAHKIGVEEKDERASYHYSQLAYSTGHPAGLHVMARCYKLGIGVTENPKTYDRLIQEAAEKGFPISLYNQGLDHDEVGRDKEAEKVFTKAAEAGYYPARPNVVDARLYAQAVRADTAENVAEGNEIMKQAVLAAAKYLREGSDADCPVCSYKLANLYSRYPEFLPRKEAVRYLERAAEAGYGIAQVLLARELARAWWMIEKDEPWGLGLEQNHTEAFKWATLAAKQESPQANSGVAHLVLANLYRNGSTAARIPAHWPTALRHCKRAEELKHPGALILQSFWHRNGVVVTERPDANKAFLLAAEAAASKDDRAYLWLGDLYDNKWIPPERLARADKLPNGEVITRHHALHYYTLAATHSRGKVSPYFGLQAAKDRLKAIGQQVQEEKKEYLRHNPMKKPPAAEEFEPEYMKRFRVVYPADAALLPQLTGDSAPKP